MIVLTNYILLLQRCSAPIIVRTGHLLPRPPLQEASPLAELALIGYSNNLLSSSGLFTHYVSHLSPSLERRFACLGVDGIVITTVHLHVMWCVAWQSFHAIDLFQFGMNSRHVPLILLDQHVTH